MDRYTIPGGSLISYMSMKLKTGGGINLAQGLPGFEPPEALLQNLFSLAQPHHHQYAPTTGLKPLVQYLADDYATNGLDKFNVMITNGATEALSLLYLYLHQKKNAKLVVTSFDPAYESFIKLPEIYGDVFHPIELDLDGNKDLDELEKELAQLRPDLFLVASPGNPYGKTWSSNELAKMAQLARKYNFTLIVDIVYHQLYRGEAPVQIPYETFNDHVFIVNSFSKTLSITGWRLGYLACHQSHFEALCNIHDFTGLNSPAPLQEAVWRFINAGLMPQYTSWLRSQLLLSYQSLYSALQFNGFTVSETGGGYFIWARLPEPFSNGFKFAVDLYDNQKVAVVPGIHFSSNAHDFLRFNFARPMPEIQKAIEGISSFIKTETQCNP